jgi:hypothetical protein
VRDSTGRVRVDWVPSGDVVYSGPLVVLTSRESASASEIVAGALQSLGRAIIVGDHATHGKGTVQAIFEIDRGLLAQFVRQAPTPSGGIKVTIQKFYLPDGASTQNKGVLSDVSLPSINDVLPIGEADLPHALPWDTIARAPMKRNEKWNDLSLIDDSTRDLLLKKSLERQKVVPEFKYLSEIVNRLKSKQAEKALSLNYDVRQKEKQLNEDFSVTMEKKRRELNRERYASAEVLLDISWKMKGEHQEKLRNTPLPDGRKRENAVYENIFYYAPKDGMEIKEIRADKLNYEALAAYTDTFSKRLNLTNAQVESLWDHFRQGEGREEFNIRQVFEKSLGTNISKERLDELPKKFFELVVELNPELAQEHSQFDIPLREALRVTRDWAELNENKLAPVPVNAAAAKN